MASIDVESVFRKCGVTEIRDIEKQVKSDIERKKEELRQMVGRRYRDIIDAADNINEMRVSSENILSAVRCIQESVDRLPAVQHKLAYSEQKSLSALLAIDQPASAVTLSKCIADVLQLAYDGLDAHNPLESAWCFIIAEYLYRTWNIKYSKNADPVARTFLEKQFVDAGRWRQTVIRAAKETISDCFNSLETTLDAACAMAILERADFGKVVDRFLSCRMEALLNAFKNHEDSSREQIVQCLLVFQKTVLQIYQLFLPSDDASRALDRIRSLVASRWSPASVIAYEKSQTRTVVVAMLDTLDYSKVFVSSSFVDVNATQVCDSAKKWTKDAFEYCSAKLSELLKYFDTIDSLTAVKENIIVSLSEHSESFEWKSACQKLFGEDLSLWRTLCVGSLSERLNEVIQKNVEDAFNAVVHVASMNFQETTNEISDGIIMEESKEKPACFTALELAARGLADRIYRPIHKLNARVAAIDSALAKFLTRSGTGSFESTWSFTFDEAAMHTTLGTVCVAATEKLLTQIDNNARKWEEVALTAMNSDKAAVDNLVALAKLIQCLCDFTGAIKKRILRMQSLNSESRNATNSDQWSLLKALLVERAGQLYKTWMKFIAADASTTFLSHLLSAVNNVEFWLDHATEWESVQIEEETEEGQKVSANILIPTTCSRYVLELMHSVSGRLIEAGAQSMQSHVLASLLGSLRLLILESFEKALNDEKKDDNASLKLRQRQAIQLLFDFNLSMQMLHSSRGGPTEKDVLENLQHRIQRITEHLESHIDPFDLDVMKPYLKTNVGRMLYKVQALYQPLCTADALRLSKPASRTSATGGSEMAQLLPLAVCQSRFYLLPIATQFDQNPASAQSANTTAIKGQRQTTIQGHPEQGMTVYDVQNQAARVHGTKTSFASTFYDKLSSSWFGSN